MKQRLEVEGGTIYLPVIAVIQENLVLLFQNKRIIRFIHGKFIAS